MCVRLSVLAVNLSTTPLSLARSYLCMREAKDYSEGGTKNILQKSLYSRVPFITTMHLMLVKQATALSWRLL